jgi:hypothetical protein
MSPRLTFVAAPVLVFGYGMIRILDGLDGARGPGLAWTAGHLCFLGALAMFVATFWQMRRMAGGGHFATAVAALGTAGVVTLFAQFGIDIVVGFLAADHAAMSDLFDRVQSVPGVSAVVYEFGPYLFYIGQLLLAIQLAVAGRVRVWTPLLVAVDMTLPLVDKDLIPIGAVCLLISFLPLARRSAAAATPATA